MSSSKRVWVVLGILACIAAAIYSRSAVSTGAPSLVTPPELLCLPRMLTPFGIS